MAKASFFMVLQLILIFISVLPFTLSLNQEGLLLYQVKLGLDDPDNVLSSWNEQDDTPCEWYGVTCDLHSQSVTSVDLPNANLGGPFPASLLCRLQKLSHVSFYNNYINSTLVERDVATCRSLTFLDLGQNLLTGTLPETLADLPNLMYLDLTGNNFSGEIPASFGSFRRLEVLSLVANLLEGTIPAELGECFEFEAVEFVLQPVFAGSDPARGALVVGM